ncbi:putative unusual protein kinase regulating ubiquinone biosynthesis (AarF/ABC1/UbiB family) [Actinoplanes campanulatus]|uniref:Putative unusual protein kinase regulating ubiquinone biosynthesis (AarF/ABC1/UbiB family) n=1 Tax=Actinoplanes campanulatus TaxID=113559 RepID=A0A7W5ABW1_9ACTN|nr:AarF/ABC1/UbiB kinase family protein [Actinoplanes campanulatus]MBB3093437.1 putative unusual protein kinase regulating ubiquinone biosynthesis (AarF/ABC1/UbiB family) [Actinoplanes campanulatus]GGN50177.1 ABC transporter ATP-binding protein [Actinoplanes campanulatus]GID42447.1 ABC transporter ATP-binding protein [Actinoplanes campanulatus]
MTDIPRRAASRTAKLAALPLGFAGRAALGLGKRAVGIASDVISADIQQRTAEQIFSVLGQLKGGAMKFGQALSVFEAALPEEMAGPYRQALTKLQEAAPPMPVANVHKALAEQLGPDWRDRFAEFDDGPAAAASIGQVHRAVWKLPPARRNAKPKLLPVAVKVQYPGAGDALIADLKQLSRLAGMFKIIQPGIDVKPLLAELRERITEELDYEMEAETQRAFAEAYRDDPEIFVPRVVASAPRVLVTEWVDGTPLAEVITGGSPAERDEAGRLMAVLHFSAPGRAGLLHADPHPGNFRILPDGRLGVIDFGAVARLPEGHPEPIGRLVRLALDGQAQAVVDGLRDEGFVKATDDLDAQALLDFLLPMIEPVGAERFRFTRSWLRSEATRLTNPRGPAYQLSRRLNLPPSYLLIHRVTLGSIGVLCQLEAEASYREILEEWLPGFAPIA